MMISGKGLAEILSHEALVTRRYKDSVGVWTVGVGHTAAAGAPDPLTVTVDQPVAELIKLFRSDLRRYEADVSRAVKVPLAQHEFDALVSFHFNTGAIGRASFVKLLNAGDREGAAKGMMSWRRPPEIVGRRTKEMKLFRDGVYSNTAGTFMVYPAGERGGVLWAKGKRTRVADVIADLRQPVPPRPVGNDPAVITARLKAKVEDVQRSLIDFGYPVGKIDGIIGTLTTAALAAYRFDRHLPPAEGIDDGLIADMIKASDEGFVRPISEERATMPSTEIAKGSRTMKVSWWGRALMWFGIPSAMAGQAAEEAINPEQLETRLTFVGRMTAWAMDNLLLMSVLLAVGGGTFIAFKVIDSRRVQAYRKGWSAT